MNLNLFRVLSPVEQEAQRQHADRDTWHVQCRSLGATPAQLDAYEESAQAFARTTIYPNTRIVAEARRAALEALRQGKPLPADAEAAVQSVWARDLAKLIGL
jgi:lipase chaperone LimK